MRNTLVAVRRISDCSELMSHHAFLSFKKLSHRFLEERVCFQIQRILIRRRSCYTTLGVTQMPCSIGSFIHPWVAIVVMCQFFCHDLFVDGITVGVGADKATANFSAGM